MGFFSSLFEGDDKPGKKLIEASKSGDTEKVKGCLAEGAGVNVSNKDGVTALMHASGHGHAGVVELLIAKGANVNAKAGDGTTALMHAAGHGHTKVVKKFRNEDMENNEKKK